jgi:hypothetical protein
MSSTEFASRTRALERGTRELLASRVRPPSRLSDPELRKNLERLYRAMVDAQRLAGTGDLDESKQNDLLARLDGVDPTELNSQSLGLVLEAIDEFLIEHGDALFICQLLAAEYMRARAESGTTVLTWTDLFPGPPLDVSMRFEAGQHVEKPELDEARNRLLELFRARGASYGLHRARTLARARRLLWLLPVLAALITGLIVSMDIAVAGQSWRGGLVAAFAGALGASLSGAYKLRDQAPRVSELRIFGYLFAVQPLLGAAAGVFVALVLSSGILKVADAGDEWATRAVVAFVAGFSEPFLLKVVDRVAGTGGAKAPTG